MSRETKEWHPAFLEYIESIARHPNYTGLPIERRRDGSLAWIATRKSRIGKARKDWAEQRAIAMGLPLRYGVDADVMRELHPTKVHVCQICGSHMSIYYYYPSAYLLRAMEKEFGQAFCNTTAIDEIWDALLASGVDEHRLIAFMGTKFGLSFGPAPGKQDVLAACEYACRKNGKKLLSPGAMSNFPDRFDGFHSYNLCCRSAQDKGRSKENLKSYGKDRRAYEYWSDGNIHAANRFMNSSHFHGTSADHLGPISLGFVHDPLYLRPLSGRDNSAKRDRLEIGDVREIVSVEQRTGMCPITWYSAILWDAIRRDHEAYPERVGTLYRDMLKQNMANYMFILQYILSNAPGEGEAFLLETLILPKREHFLYTYKFDACGQIVHRAPRRLTERSENEIERFCRIAIASVREYNEKSESESARHATPALTADEMDALDRLCEIIGAGKASYSVAEQCLRELMASIQRRLLR